jgi:tetratricopeptide (TPR) repeat protein
MTSEEPPSAQAAIHRLIDDFHAAARARDFAAMIAAIEDYRIAQPNDPLRPTLFEARAAARMGRQDDALAILGAAIMRGTPDPRDRLRRERITLCLSAGDYEAALSDTEWALKADPEFSHAWRMDLLFWRATALAELGDPTFEAAVESLPDESFYVPNRLLKPDDLREIYAARKAEREQGGAT